MAATLWLLVHGCDNVGGGAVELSWKLRPASSSLPDKFVDCDLVTSATSGLPPIIGPVGWIGLHWEVRDQGGNVTSQGSQDWRCQDNHGVTGFDLAEGTANLTIFPECADRAPAAAASYIAPASVQRTVIRGDTVSLGAVELVVTVADCKTTDNPAGSPCTCPIAGLALDHTAR